MIKKKTTGEAVRIDAYCGNGIAGLLDCYKIDGTFWYGSNRGAFFRSQLVDDSDGQEINDEIARLERVREDGEL